MGFIDTMRAEGHAVESICRVLREQGCQIAAHTYRSQRKGIVAARTVTDARVHGAVRDAYDNALMETINGLYNAECIRTTVFHEGPYRTIADVEYATAGWVDWYNTRRLHSSLGYVPPAEFEQAHYATLNREPQPA